jgi:regulatory protein
MANEPYEYALNLLAARAYSVRNLRRKLIQKGFEADTVEKTIARLQANKFLDDAKFSSEFARQRLVVGGSSLRRVEQDLIRRGISRETAKKAAGSVVEEEDVDFGASMERLARKKHAALGDLDPHVQRRRLFGFLARKGYELDDINRTLDRIFP